MPRDRFLVYHFSTGRTLLLFECPLPMIGTFSTMPLLVLIDTLPSHLFLAILTCSSGFQRGLWRPVPAMPALLHVVIIASTPARLRSFHLYTTGCFETFHACCAGCGRWVHQVFSLAARLLLHKWYIAGAMYLPTRSSSTGAQTHSGHIENASGKGTRRATTKQ